MFRHSHLSRRSALTGFGIGSLGLMFGSHVSASTHTANKETGGTTGASSQPTTGHALTGRWLAMVGLPSNDLINVAVPTVFGEDGTAVMIFPGTEAAKHGIEIRGIALGEWEPVDGDTGHFTVVQVLSSLDGDYLGTVTIDGEATLSYDMLRFSVGASTHFFTVRDQSNNTVEQFATSSVNPMRAFRMRIGHAGFPDHPLPRKDTPWDPE